MNSANHLLLQGTFSIASLLAASNSFSTVASRRAMDDTRSESEGTIGGGE